jgi:hypothetical protein
MDFCKEILLNEMAQCKIRKAACIRDAKEKENLFNRQASHVETSGVVRVKSPITFLRKILVPQEKDNSCDHYCGQVIFPSLNK